MSATSNLAIGVCIWLTIISAVQSATGGCPATVSRRVGSASWQVDGADSLLLGSTAQFVHFDAASPCDRLILGVTVGSRFWSCSVWNEYSCDCVPTSLCERPAVSLPPLRTLHPFIIQFADVSTSISRPINTRKNSPLDPATLWSTNLTIPDAVDVRQLSSAVRVSLQFYPQATTTFCTELIVSNASGFECFAPQNTVSDPSYAGWLQQRFTSRRPRMGMELSRKGQQLSPLSPLQIWSVFRKPPFPSFELVLSQECCGDGAPCAARPYRSAVMQGRFYAPIDLPPFVGPCCSANADSSACRCFNFSAAVTFYESPRLYSSAFSFGNGSSPDALTGKTVEGDVVVVNTIGTYPMQFRFVRHDIPPDPSIYPPLVSPLPAGLSTLPENHTVYALYVLQPFPLKDLWVQVQDGAGVVLFEEQEVHVPYRHPSDREQVGWLFAIDHLKGRDAPGVQIVARYNRRGSLGRREEEVRCALVLRWLADLGSGPWSRVIAPIPTTILLDRGVLGMVAAASLSSGSVIARVPFRAVLTSRIALDWFNATLGYKCFVRPAARSSEGFRGNCSELITNITNSDEQNALDRFYLAVFAALKGVNPRDNTSSWFPLFDSFYPEQPPHLPWFQDSHTLQRLYGFSEIPRLIEERLIEWRKEYLILTDAFPWLAEGLTDSRWASIRAWVMASSYWNGTHCTLLPGVNLMRHGAAPNVNLVIDPATNDVRLVASQNIAASSELFPNVNPSQIPLHKYFLLYGQTPTASPLVATVPGLNTFLGSSDASRALIVNELSSIYGEDYKTSLGRFLALIGTKLGTLPTAVDGLGSDPATVTLAEALLESERIILTQQFADGTNEYNSL